MAYKAGDAMKRLLNAALPALALVLCLCGCGALAEQAVTALPERTREAALDAVRSWSGSRWSLQDPIDEFFAAVDARDAGAVKALFSPNVQAADQDLDRDIQALFDLYPGPTEDCEMRSPVGASQHVGWGANMARVHNLVPVVCQGVSYYCSFSYTTKDEADEGNVGVTRVVFVTEKVQANDAFRRELAAEDGLTVVPDCPGDYETRRIGDSPFIFTPMDRTVTQEDLTAFLETEDRWETFAARFGQPNAESWGGSSVYYELAPEEGRPRYAHVCTEDRGDGVVRVSRVYLFDDREYQPIGTIWKNETDSDEAEKGRT